MLNFKSQPGSLNPCCYGRWSQRSAWQDLRKAERVLILVVMEDGLRDSNAGIFYVSNGLNPCCYGRWSQSLRKITGVAQRTEKS